MAGGAADPPAGRAAAAAVAAHQARRDRGGALVAHDRAPLRTAPAPNARSSATAVVSLPWDGAVSRSRQRPLFWARARGARAARPPATPPVYGRDWRVGQRQIIAGFGRIDPGAAEKPAVWLRRLAVSDVSPRRLAARGIGRGAH